MRSTKSRDSTPICIGTDIVSRGSRLPSLEPLAVLEIDPEQAVGIAHRNGGPFAVQVPLHAHDLFGGVVEIGDVGHGDVLGHLLLESQARLRSVDDSGHDWVGGIDLHAACAQKALELTAGLLGEGLAEEAAPSSPA